VRWALGDGLLNSQDETWLRQRRFIQPLFTRRRIAGYAQSMAEEAGDLTRRWRELSAGGNPIDLHAEMSRVTLRVVGGSCSARTWSARSPWSATPFRSSGIRPPPGFRPVPGSAQLADPVEPSRPACRIGVCDERSPTAAPPPAEATTSERFVPERESGRHRHAYFPFGAGPRACIGQYFSMLEAAIALAVIVRDHELTSLGEHVPPAPRITLHPAAPVPCRLTPLRA
jgi:cytochrome P450